MSRSFCATRCCCYMFTHRLYHTCNVFCCTMSRTYCVLAYCCNVHCHRL